MPKSPLLGNDVAPPSPAPAVGTPADTHVDVTPEQAGLRDLRDDPRREEMIRRLAREKAERVRKAREAAGIDID